MTENFYYREEGERPIIRDSITKFINKIESLLNDILDLEQLNETF